MKSSELTRMLEEQQSLGRLDSSGEFTVELSAALTKLGRYQATRPSFPLLKFLQAAMAREARRIDVSLGRERVEVRVDTDQDLCLEALLAQLRDPLRRGNPVARHLCLGLAAALFAEPSLILVEDSRGRELVFREGRHELRERERSGGGWRIVLHRRGARGFLEWLRRRLFASADEHRDLCTRAAHASVPLFVDGRELNNLYLQDDPAPRSLALDLADRYLVNPLPGLPVFPGPARRRAWAQRSGGSFGRAPGKPRLKSCSVVLHEMLPGSPARFGRPKQKRPPLPEVTSFEPLPCLARITIPAALRGHSTVTFVRDGLILERVREDLGCPGVRAVVDTGGLEVDLSEFQLVRNEEYEALLDYLRRQVQTMLQSSLPLLKKGPPKLVAHLRRRLPKLAHLVEPPPERRSKKKRQKQTKGPRTYDPRIGDNSDFRTERQRHRGL